MSDVIDVDEYYERAEDVDEFYKRYEALPGEVFESNSLEFRQSVRSAREESEPERQGTMHRSGSSSWGRQRGQKKRPSFPGRGNVLQDKPRQRPMEEIPSSLGPAIQQVRAKRANPEQTPSSGASNAPVAKRRRVDPLARVSTPPNAVAGPSRTPSVPRLPTRPPSPPSPEIEVLSHVSNPYYHRPPTRPPQQQQRQQSQLPRPIPVHDDDSDDDIVMVLDNLDVPDVAPRQVLKAYEPSHFPIATRPPQPPRPPKRRREAPVPVPSGSGSSRASTSSVPPNRRTERVEVIELFDEEEDEEDDDWQHPGMDLNDPDTWIPFEGKENKLEITTQPDETPESAEETDARRGLETLSISTPASDPLPPRSERRIQPDTSRWSPVAPPPMYPPIYIWDKLRLAGNLRFKRRPRSIFSEFPRKLISRPLDVDLNLGRLKQVHSFKEAPGAINAIEQKGKWTIIGSACHGGLADIPNEIISQWNRPGSLMIWSNKLEIPVAHKSVKFKGSREERTKYYAVNDVKFDPTSMSFASTGEDKKLRLWSLSEDGDTGEPLWKVDVTYNKFDHVPHDLAFRPGSSVLAVAAKNVYLYKVAEETVTPAILNMKERLSPNVIGSMAWGQRSTADHLFVSSEPNVSPLIERLFTGTHKVFDTQAKKSLYQLDAEEAGDALAVDPSGTTLALCTQAAPNKHLLRLYDIHRQDPQATTSISLVPFSARHDRFEGEINVAAFSPDEIYLALARNDNHIHVYDRRMMSTERGPVFDYEHRGESKIAVAEETYGVVNAVWVRSEMTRRMALVTGGEDGCVRMWDPMLGVHDRENGKVVAEVNSDIGQLSLGDPFAGEHRLVVGDASGEVTIFDIII